MRSTISQCQLSEFDRSQNVNGAAALAQLASDLGSSHQATGTLQCTLQLPEVHMFIGITRFVRNVWAHVTFH